MSDIYRRIKERREELGLTQEDLAVRMGYKSKSSINKIEMGKNDIPQSKVVAFAKALQTTTAYLMGVDEAKDSIQIPPGFDPLPRTVRRPIVGDIACGDPITAEQNIQDYAEVPEQFNCDFCLRCHGDSMVDAGIQDGDIVYIHIQPVVNDGEIAAVRIGDEATLKRVYYDGTTITLVPANSAYRPKSYSGPALNDIQIEGKAVGFTHWFG